MIDFRNWPTVDRLNEVSIYFSSNDDNDFVLEFTKHLGCVGKELQILKYCNNCTYLNKQC